MARPRRPSPWPLGWAGGVGSGWLRWPGGLRRIWETVTRAGFWRALFFFPKADEYRSAESWWGQERR